MVLGVEPKEARMNGSRRSDESGPTPFELLLDECIGKGRAGHLGRVRSLSRRSLRDFSSPRIDPSPLWVWEYFRKTVRIPQAFIACQNVAKQWRCVCGKSGELDRYDEGLWQNFVCIYVDSYFRNHSINILEKKIVRLG